METPPKKEFQIGWICALPIEAAAAILMLDENFGILQEQERSDTNTYTLGRIGRHHVVIACLPDGQYGTTSATTVANNMMRTFSDSLRIGLMVGIGGGAPSAEHDIRLGDIVVSRPEGSHGGVIQHDVGKIRTDGKFKRVGSLNRPPKSLLNALAQMRAAELYNDPQYPLYIQEAIEKNTRTRKIFSHPNVESDRLFKIQYEHLDNATSCDQCSVEWEEDRITRQDHDPHTHYGTIASANTLIKDGNTREAIRKQTGALCFEMEAAGMMADFPCLVIRGICDYADSHNNKQWQSYAALAAAAYTKELLSYVPKMVFGETLLADICSVLEDINIDQRTAFDQPESHHREKMERVLTEDQRRCRRAFRTSTYERFKSINPNRVEGTCEWVLNSPEYLRWWNATSNDLLWISADPGCGKSVLAKSLIDEVFPLSGSNIFVLYFFFKDNEGQDNLAAALCAVLHQLFILQPQLLRHALPSWRRNRENIQYLVEDLWRIFMAATSDPAFENTICVFDALDECRNQDQKVLIERLRDFHNRRPASQGNWLKFLMTSRPYGDIQDCFWPVTEFFPQIHLRGEEENDQIHKEINLVIKVKVAELGKGLALRADTQERLERELCEMKHRTYLWLYLAIDDIKRTLKNSLRPDREIIPSLPKNVSEAYERILGRVTSDQMPMVETILRIIIGARRPLTVREMAMALGVATTPWAETATEAGLSPNGLDKKIRQLCGLFVFIKEFKIYLIHQTAREFLIGRHDRSMSTRWHLDQRKTEIQMADICMKYLLMNDLVTNDEKSVRSLLDYSAENWADHFRDVVFPEDEMVDRAWKLYDVKTERFRLWFPIFWKAAMPYDGDPRMNAMHLAAFNGHENVLSQLAAADRGSIDQSDWLGTNALQWACMRGYFGIVHELLEKGADVNALGGSHGNALQGASAEGHLEIVQLLLEKGADINAQGGEYGNALQGAAIRGYLEIVQLLLEKGADINAQGGKYGNALQGAAIRGHLGPVQLLLEGGADINAQGGEYGNALQGAAIRGHLEIVQLLLEKGADINAQGGEYGNALQGAAIRGHLGAVQLLLEKGADINAQGGKYGNALQAAAEGGYLEIIQLLIEQGVDVNAHGGKYGDALQAAAEGGHLEIVQLLLQKGADVHANAIQAASQGGYNEIVQICLGNADTVDAQAAEYIDKDYDTDSDLSDDASIFSASSSQSFSSAGSDNDARQTAAQHLAHILYNDADLQHLYFQAMQKLGEDRFARNHDRLLKRYFKELRLETRDPLFQKTARFLQNQSQRKQVTAMICQQIQSKSSSIDLSAVAQRRNKEDREYRLDLLLKKHSGETGGYDAPLIQGSEGYDDYDSENEDSEEHEEENDAHEEEEEDREMKDGQIQPFSRLESIVKYFNSGASFKAFKSRLNGFINPPLTIEQALGSRDIKALRRLLKKQFNAVAAGDYSWIKELDEIGYTRDDIADLLFEQANDTPWIYFEPCALEPTEVKASVHLPGCVHQLFSFAHGLLSSSVIPPLGTSRSKNWKDITRAAQELCGLAGIKPTSRDLGKWNGSVQFEEENSVALVSYARPACKDSQEHRAVISMISKAIEGFCSAAGHIQAAGLCCDSFTILRQPIHSPEQHQTEIAVEMCRVNFKLGLQMQEELGILSNKLTPNLIDYHTVQRVALEVLGPFIKSATVFCQFNDIATILHTCSLAVQLMCLGLLSYSQAHIGPIQAFFLDTALSKIRLLGSQMFVGERERIEVSLSELTCIGNMTGGPVLTFNLFEPQAISRSIGELQTYDLIANAEDLLDTWGPGQFIFRKKGDRFPCAIRLGDGFVWCSNFEQCKFHWSQEATHESISCGELNPCRKIIIGTSITVNENCRVNESDCWKNSSLEQLGPHEPYWLFDEKQYGFQAGNYFLVQVNGSSHKYQGLTLKQVRLHPLNNDMLISFLNQLWGVQVSFCTGVARRVPLHELVADMLPVFAVVLTNSKIERRLWEELETTHHIIDAFRNNRVHECLRNLSPELHQQAMKMTRKIFDVLQHTGLNRSETHLLVAWPNERDIFRCFKVPCQKQNSWVPVLADSEDCATFAYISTKCFETENIKCGGPNVSWRNAIPLLETAVKVHPKTDTTTISSLEDKSTYFFRKFDKLFFVQVKKPEGAGTAILTTFRSNMPSQIKRRIFEKFMTEEKKVQSRLCEKVILDDIAEQVVVTMSKESP